MVLKANYHDLGFNVRKIAQVFRKRNSALLVRLCGAGARKKESLDFIYYLRGLILEPVLESFPALLCVNSKALFINRLGNIEMVAVFFTQFSGEVHSSLGVYRMLIRAVHLYTPLLKTTVPHEKTCFVFVPPSSGSFFRSMSVYIFPAVVSGLKPCLFLCGSEL